MGISLESFITNIDQNLVCDICTSVFDQAVITTCGHSFCKSCLSLWLATPENNTCPTCRSYVSKHDLIPNISVRNLVGTLLVRCGNFSKGCKQILSLDRLETHTKTCDFTEEECVACKQTLPKIELAKHSQVCPAIKEKVCLHQKRRKSDRVPIDVLSRRIAMLEIELNRTKRHLKWFKLHYTG